MRRTPQALLTFASDVQILHAAEYESHPENETDVVVESRFDHGKPLSGRRAALDLVSVSAVLVGEPARKVGASQLCLESAIASDEQSVVSMSSRRAPASTALPVRYAYGVVTASNAPEGRLHYLIAMRGTLAAHVSKPGELLTRC